MKLLIDYPDYSHANPWQLRMIETCSPFEVLRTNDLVVKDCFAYHISWESFMLINKNKFQIKSELKKVKKFLELQSKKSKIIWTLHNITNLNFPHKIQERVLREMLMEYSSLIILMSDKHRFMIPKKHQGKIRVIPHYIDAPSELYQSKSLSNKPKFFKYGNHKRDTNDDLYNYLLENDKIDKFISDSSLSRSIHCIDTKNSFITNRRFSEVETDLYSSISNFSIFYRKPNLNSGVLNYYIGKKLVILHDMESVKYLDLPQIYSNFEGIRKQISVDELYDFIDIVNKNNDQLDDFINKRNPINISKLFWETLMDL